MAGDGWVKILREIKEHPVWSHDGILKLFINCVIDANWKQGVHRIPGSIETCVVNRGQFITGQQSLFKSLYPEHSRENPDSRTVWRWLHALAEMQCVELKTVSHRFTLVTVCNYETYQVTETPSVKPVSEACHGDVKDVSTIEEGKEGKEGKKKGARKVFSKPTCEQVAEYCRERSNSIDPQKFIDYYTANGWRVGRGTMCDWKAAVRNWETNQLASPKKKSSGPRVPTEEELANWNPYAGQD